MSTLAEHFASNLKRIRSRRKLSQQAVAETAHLSVSMISMLERAQWEPSFSTIEQLAAALAVKPVDLLRAA